MKNRSLLFVTLWFFVLSIGSFSSCSDDNISKDNPSTIETGRLVSVVSEYSVDKNTLAEQIAEYAKAQNIQVTPFVLSILMNDVDVASILYTTTGVDGKVVTASGVVAMPKNATSYNRLLSIQHSTLDIDDAPSVKDFNFELLPATRNRVVAMADYLGYGISKTPDCQHPYLHLKLTGSTCADMITAAQEYLRRKSIKAQSDSIDLLGYSQGGAATIATVLELEQRDERSKIGEVSAGGGAYDLESIFQYFLADTAQSYPRMGYIPYIVRGLVYGDQLSVNETHLYAPQLIANGGLGWFSTKPLSQWHSLLGKHINKVLHPDFFASPSYNGNADVIAVLSALRKNSLVNAHPQSMIHLYHSPTDDFLPYSNAENAHRAWPNSSLTNLTMSGHEKAGVEFMLRTLDLWTMFSSFIPKS